MIFSGHSYRIAGKLRKNQENDVPGESPPFFHWLETGGCIF
jgi:hypothetical protein